VTQDWWKSTTIYQIYPRSFADSNNDGIGDISGIISKLDYIQELGFETIWLSPHYVSPQKDFGYDIADFRNVAPEYGTMKDAETLISEIHKRGMKIIFDMILNHTSDQHPWFLESRSSKDNPKRDWYIWRDGKGKSPPTNWKAIPGGDAWKYDKNTKQWFYHNFLSFQPDLNFRNPEVKQEMLNTLRFWLDKGVDGFRLDIFHSIFKDKQFRNNPFSWRMAPTPDQKEGFFQKLQYNLNRPETFEFAKEVRSLLDEYQPSRFAVGEVFGEGIVKKYLGDNNNGLNLILLFDLIHLNKVNAASIREIIEQGEQDYPAPLIPTYCLGNHDRRRYFDRIGKDTELAKLLALFLYTTRCVPINYYGDELALPDGDFPFKNALDSLAHPYWWMSKAIAKSLDLYINRDGCRTPMQWNSDTHAGFSETSPWLPVHADHPSCNVEKLSEDKNSILNFHRALLKLRNESRCLREGKLELISDNLSKDIVAYDRSLESNPENNTENEKNLRVVMNYSKQSQSIDIPEKLTAMRLSSNTENSFEKGKLHLRGLSGVVLI
jgi:oligo-1,6-glucosidase/alpha-glucosidase